MKLQYLVLSNIGPFHGTHTIDLTTNKKSTGFAFFAANGRGKTTIYNAMKWCLFGEVKTRVRAARGKKIQATIRPISGKEEDKPLINNLCYATDKFPEMQVILFAEGSQGSIQVTRTAKVNRGEKRRDHITHELTVVHGENSTSDLSEGEEMIQKFFPSSLQQFFFIDGEALEEYQNMIAEDSILGIKEEIEAVLRIPTLQRGLGDFQNLKSNISEQISKKSKLSKIQSKAVDEARRLQVEINAAEQKIHEIKIHIEEIESQLLDIDTQLNNHGEMAVIIKEQNDLRIRLESAIKALSRSSENKVSLAKEAYKILIWKQAESLHSNLEQQIDAANTKDWKKKMTQKQIDNLSDQFETMDGICKECGQKIPDIEAHKKKIKTDIEELKGEIQRLDSGIQLGVDELRMSLGRLTAMKPQRGDLERVMNAEMAWKEDKSTVESLTERLKNISSKVPERATIEVEDLSRKKVSKEQFLRELNVKLNKAEDKSIELQKEHKIAIQKSGKNTGTSDLSKSMDTVERLIKTIENTIARYSKEARKKVEMAASKVFMDVTNASANFDGISLDENFRAKIRLKSGGFATAPSSGMNSMMTISIIDGLRQVSKLNAPIFFDTPGRSLDEEHKQAMLEYFWRDSGQQFLIFAHSGEFKLDETIDTFGPKIAKAWELKWPGDFRYCRECNSENIMHSKRQELAECLDCKHKWDTSETNTEIIQLEI